MEKLIYAKSFKFNVKNDSNKLANQILMAKKRYFHESDDVKFTFGLEGMDFINKKFTVKMETEI